MANYKTPGVYVEEVSAFPPSVTQVSTAIPAFIGYTERPQDSELQQGETRPLIRRIDTLLDYRQIFGGPPSGDPQAVVQEDPVSGAIMLDSLTPPSKAPPAVFYLYYAIELYFKNGGGSCYVVSIGEYGTNKPTTEGFTGAFQKLQQEDEPTILVMPDAVLLGNDDYNDVCRQALGHCALMGDRFAILDVRSGSDAGTDAIGAFRNGIGTNNLNRGAAYYPYLQTTAGYEYQESNVGLSLKGMDKGYWSLLLDSDTIRIEQLGAQTSPKVIVNAAGADGKISFDPSADSLTLTIGNVSSAPTGTAVATAWRNWTQDTEQLLAKSKGFGIQAAGGGSGSITLENEKVLTTVAYRYAKSNVIVSYSGTSTTPKITIALADNAQIVPPTAPNNCLLTIHLVKLTVGDLKTCLSTAPGPFDGFRVEYQGVDGDVIQTESETPLSPWKYSNSFGSCGIEVTFVVTGTNPSSLPPKVTLSPGTQGQPISVTTPTNSTNNTLIIDNISGKTGADVARAWQIWLTRQITAGFSITSAGTGNGSVQATATTGKPLQQTNLADIEDTQPTLYNAIKSALSEARVVLPPSAAIAGVYAQVDRTRGVWKAPANVSLAGVIGPMLKITDAQQADMNDPDDGTGKAINAIRAFTGEGTLVWGARTLDGSSNDWRYINVRRLFSTIEESAKRASKFAVFEPNDASTWLKVKAMIESYLYGLWEQGALAGPTPEKAYYVRVGLGVTMTSDDVNAGRMIVKLGIAASRPAEFVILSFTQQAQSA